MTDPLVQIQNHHSPACGDPPIVDGRQENQYIGYFENAFGEQWIFTYDRKAARAILRGGDAGWSTEFEVVDGRVSELALNRAEQLWLEACWSAASK